MKKIALLSLIAILFLAGCGRGNLSPFSPNLNQKLDNQQGRINELENMNNALKVQLEGVKNQAEIHARDIESMQQGVKNNSGVQILQGDGTLIVILVLGLAGLSLVSMIIFYRNKAQKSEKTAQILAQQLSMADEDTTERVCLAALNTEVETDVFHLLTKNKVNYPRP